MRIQLHVSASPLALLCMFGGGQKDAIDMPRIDTAVPFAAYWKYKWKALPARRLGTPRSDRIWKKATNFPRGMAFRKAAPTRSAPDRQRATSSVSSNDSRCRRVSSVRDRRGPFQHGREDQRRDAPADDSGDRGRDEDSPRRKHALEKAPQHLERLGIDALIRLDLAHRVLEQRVELRLTRGREIDRVDGRRHDRRDRARAESDHEALPERDVAAVSAAKASERHDEDHDRDDETDEAEPRSAGEARHLHEQAIDDLERGEDQRELPYRRPNRYFAAGEILVVSVSHCGCPGSRADS